MRWLHFICYFVFTRFCLVRGLSGDVLDRFIRSTERDPYVFNLFEMILTTLDSKLKHVERMDRAISKLSEKLDEMNNKLTLTSDTTSKVAHILDVKVPCFPRSENALPKITRVVRHRPYFTHEEHTADRREFGPNSHIGGGNIPRPKPFIRSSSPPPVRAQVLLQPDKLESKLEEVFHRVLQVDQKLLNLHEQLHRNKKSQEVLDSEPESHIINEENKEKTEILAPLQESVDNVRNSIASVDQRLQAHANTIGKNFGQMSKEIYYLKNSLEEQEKERRQWMCGESSRNGTGDTCQSPLDGLRSETEKIIQTILEKKEEETEETNVIKEEQTKQAKTLRELNQKFSDTTSKILGKLAEVRNDLKKEKGDGSDHHGRSINPVVLLQRSKLSERRSPTSSSVKNISFEPQESSIKESILKEESSDRSRHSGVIFPQKPHGTKETAFLKTTSSDSDAYTCLELRDKGEQKDGVFHLKIQGTNFWFLQVYCDMTTDNGGWTVIQRRDDFGTPRESFTRDWEDYKHGFGDPSKEFWLGNENIYMLTNSDKYSLRVMLEDFDGNKRYAEYSTFKLHSEEDNYKLEIGGYSGNAGDSLNDPWYGSNLSPFSTLDRDNDRSSLNCASMLKGGWWWRSCGRGLNGLYSTNPNDFTARQGVVWFRWKGWDYTLKKTVLMIRPKIVADEEPGT